MIPIRKFIRALCIIVFIISAYALIELLIVSPLRTKKNAQDVQSVYYDETPANTKENKIENLRKINSEICGWIKIEDTNIDYPVLYRPGDTDFYLTHDYKKESSRYGSITVDSRCKDGVKSRNVILHGHHMKDGQMFADLLKFENVEFCKKHPVIQFDTLENEGKWKVFAIFKTNTLSEHGGIFDYYITNFISKSEFNQYIKEVKRRSLIDFPADVKYTDQLLTLSTCSYERKDFRTVVMARRLRRNESEDANVDKIKKAEAPLMPDCYYK